MKYSKKELRFWSNWTFIVLVAPLYSTSLYGISTSFHQFVTNPTQDEIYQLENTTNEEIEPGLGESELFYSLVLSATHLGAMIGGITSGFLVRSVPYWYLWAVPLTFNTIAFAIYSLSNQGWLIMISRLLTGYFLGANLTLGFSYLTTSSQAYRVVKKELGKEMDEKAVIRLRDYLFSAMNVGYSSGVLISSGVTIILAQFGSVNQFRAIGWFNLAYSVVAIVLHLIMFRGEMECKRTNQSFQLCPNKEKDSTSHFGLLSLFISYTFCHYFCKISLTNVLYIIISLLVLSLIDRARFVFVLTMFNPIASDSFGIDERGGTYFFLALCVSQVTGSIVLIILQRLKVSSQALTLLAVITTMLGYLIVTDWQTIPYDPCTEFSPFHHPGIVQRLNTSGNVGFIHPLKSPRHTRDLNTPSSTQTAIAALPKLTSINLLSNIDVQIGTTIFSLKANLGTSFSCKRTETCDCDHLPSKCLRFSVGSNESVMVGSGVDQEAYQCSSSFKLKSPVTLCVLLSRKADVLSDVASIESFLETASGSDSLARINTIDILPDKLNQLARTNCIQANVSGHQCHWIPYSDIFKKECEDCQPICRSVHQTLTFPQFIIGNCLLVLITQMVPLVALLMNQSPEQIQGIVIGCMTAMNSIARTVAPLLVDAAYEGMQKRTFLVTMLLAFIHIPFIIEIVVLYPKLGPRTEQVDTEKDSNHDQYKYSKLEPFCKDQEN